MLPIPNQNHNVACIVGIDPGTENLGVGLVWFNIDNYDIVKCASNTYRGSRLAGSDWSEAIHGARYRRIEALMWNLSILFNREKPIVIGSESAFINVRRPQAYGALTEVVTAIRHTVQSYDLFRPLYMVPPSTVKNAIGCKGNADKEAVKNSVLKIEKLTSTCESEIALMDEHSVDALAVAYAMLNLMKEDKLDPLNI
jgi:Holliday junction resolvasome RuvABC endonuclease subunit